MSNLRLSRQHATQLAGISAALIVAFAGGCGSNESQALKQIRKAEQTIGALTADGTFATLADESRRKQLNELHDSMNALASSGPEGVRAAAFSIAARAKAGIAALDAKEANTADQQLSQHLTDLRNGLNTFTLQKSIAVTNTGAGTEGLIKTLQASLDANKTAAEAARKEAAKGQAAVDELTTRVKGVSAQAAAKRQEAASIAAGMQGATATQGLEIVKRSTAVLAQADALEQQAADLGTQLGLAQSELSRARSTTTALDEQTHQIQNDIAGAQSHLDAERKLAETAGKAAEAAAGAIKAKYAEFNTFRTGTLESGHQKAVTSAQKSVDLSKQAASKAGAQTPAATNAAKLATATMQQNYADALVSQARAQDQIAGTLSLLGTAQPALPNAAEFTAAADAARKASDDTLTQARELYGSIRESLDGIGDDKLKSRLSETSKILENLSSKQGVKAVEPAPAAPAPADKQGGTPAAAAGEGEVAAVRAVLDQYHDKVRSGDMKFVLEQMTFFTGEEQRTFANVAVSLAESVKSFDAACQEKLGVSGEEALGAMGNMAKSITEEIEKDKNRTGRDYTIKVDGDKAVASKSEGKPETLVKKNGKWMMTMDVPPGAEAMGVQFGLITSVLNQLTADIKSGKITSAAQVQTAIAAKMGGFGRPNRGGQPGGDSDPNK
jgi:hypothetical protein